MTDTAKPNFIGQIWPENSRARQAVLLEVHAVFAETGLTPRQLLEQRDELMRVIEGQAASLRHERCADWFPEGANNAALHMSDVMSSVADELEATLSKCGKVGW